MYILNGSCGWLPEGPIKFIAKIVEIIRNLTPVILIIIGSIDFAKAVMSQDNNQIKKAQSSFIKRIIAGVAVFFVIVIIQWVAKIINNADESTGANNAFSCLDALLNGNYKQDDKKYYEQPEYTGTTKTTNTTKKGCYCKTLEEYIQDYSYISNPQAQRKQAQEAYNKCTKKCNDDGHSSGSF